MPTLFSKISLSSIDSSPTVQDSSYGTAQQSHESTIADLDADFTALDPQDQEKHLASLLSLPFSSSTAPNATVSAGLMHTESLRSNSLHGINDVQSGYFGSYFYNSDILLATSIISFQATAPSAAPSKKSNSIITTTSSRRPSPFHPALLLTRQFQLG
jgi:hypothetical protein